MKEVIEKYLEELEKQLINGERIPLQISRDWPKLFPKEAGVYILREKGEICYCGETKDVQVRAKNLISKGSHTARKNIGIEKFSGLPNFEKPKNKKSFSPDFEAKLNRILEANFEITVISVSIGRKEPEERVVEKYKLIDNPNKSIYNKR